MTHGLDLVRLRAEAEALFASLPERAMVSGLARAREHGASPRQRAGSGEDFWQYRPFATEDTATRVDWRRSAVGDDLYVRETELETARHVRLWVDPSEGMHWTSDAVHGTKAERAAVILSALGARLARDGETCSVIGDSGKGAKANPIERLLTGFDRASTGVDGLQASREPSLTVLASDFYAPEEAISRAVMSVARTSPHGCLVQVCDPIELSFPWKGRIRFSQPGTAMERLFGRTETIRDEYLARFEARRVWLKTLCTKIGWRFFDHVTDAAPLPVAAGLQSALTAFRGRPS